MARRARLERAHGQKHRGGRLNTKAPRCVPRTRPRARATWVRQCPNGMAGSGRNRSSGAVGVLSARAATVRARAVVGAPDERHPDAPVAFWRSAKPIGVLRPGGRQNRSPAAPSPRRSPDAIDAAAFPPPRRRRPNDDCAGAYAAARRPRVRGLALPSITQLGSRIGRANDCSAARSHRPASSAPSLRARFAGVDRRRGSGSGTRRGATTNARLDRATYWDRYTFSRQLRCPTCPSIVFAGAGVAVDLAAGATDVAARDRPRSRSCASEPPRRRRAP